MGLGFDFYDGHVILILFGQAHIHTERAAINDFPVLFWLVAPGKGLKRTSLLLTPHYNLIIS
jgi:hypothetical protein